MSKKKAYLRKRLVDEASDFRAPTNTRAGFSVKLTYLHYAQRADFQHTTKAHQNEKQYKTSETNRSNANSPTSVVHNQSNQLKYPPKPTIPVKLDGMINSNVKVGSVHSKIGSLNVADFDAVINHPNQVDPF